VVTRHPARNDKKKVPGECPGSSGPGRWTACYKSVIADLKHAHHTDPNCFRENNDLRDEVVEQESVNESIFKFRDCITKNGAAYLQQRKGYNEDDAKALFIYSLSLESEGSNYGGLSALDCLAHELDFRAIIYDEIGDSAHFLRLDESKLPLINLVHLNLVAGSMAEHKPLCSRPTVLKLKESRPASSLTPHSSSSAETGSRCSCRNKLTPRQREASGHIQSMQQSQRDAFDRLVCFEKLPPGMYQDIKDRYPEEYVGLGKCHLRALHNLDEGAARKGLAADIKHNAANEVREVANNCEEHGKVFHIRKEHWVALRKVPGSGKGIYFDDMVTMEVNNYKGALAVLELSEGMAESAYNAVFIQTAPRESRPPPEESVRSQLFCSLFALQPLHTPITCIPHLLHNFSGTVYR
jgi:hypothetical protein